jgi:hypothetical protein
MKPNEKAAWMRFLLDESGRDLVEYLVLAGLIVFGAVASMRDWPRRSVHPLPVSVPAHELYQLNG